MHLAVRSSDAVASLNPSVPWNFSSGCFFMSWDTSDILRGSVSWGFISTLSWSPLKLNRSTPFWTLSIMVFSSSLARSLIPWASSITVFESDPTSGPWSLPWGSCRAISFSKIPASREPGFDMISQLICSLRRAVGKRNIYFKTKI